MGRHGQRASQEMLEIELDRLLYTRSSRSSSFYTGQKAHATVLARALAERRISVWNHWRARNMQLVANLRGINLAGRDLRKADLRRTNLTNSDLYRVDLESARLDDARLVRADLEQANLRLSKADGADFRGANLNEARLEKASLREALFMPYRGDPVFLEWADLREADLRKAKLRRANLTGATIIDTRLDEADLRKAELPLAVLAGASLKRAKLDGAEVHRVFVRNITIDEDTSQRNLAVKWSMWITRPGWLRTRDSMVNDLRVASYTSLLEEQAAAAHLINAGCNSVVLLLGRFTRRRKRVLDQLAQALRQRGKTPIVFDFPAPEQRELVDTVRFIAGLAQFVIVDLTAPSSVPLELQAVIPQAMVPVVPIVQSGHRAFAMFQDLQRRYFWVLRPVHYGDVSELLRYVDDAIVGRAEAMQAEIQLQRRSRVRGPQSIKRAKPPKPEDAPLESGAPGAT